MVAFKVFSEILDGYGHHTLAWMMAGNILFAVDILISVKLSSVSGCFCSIFAPSVTHIEVVIYQKKISLVIYDLLEKLHNFDQLTRELMNNSIYYYFLFFF